MAPSTVQTPKELELLAKIKALEENQAKFVEIVRVKVKKLENELEVSSFTFTSNVLELTKSLQCFVRGFVNLYRRKTRKMFV